MLYNVLALIYVGFAKLAALFNDKAKAFVSGRTNLFSQLQSSFEGNTSPIIWVHCASLGEFEQGRPIIEALKVEVTNHKILLTFFSPSGYEVRKNYSGADYVFYLPYDLPSHCLRFLTITKPAIAIFIKYEFWPNLFLALKKLNIPVISASSIFRKEQIYFNLFGKRTRDTLKTVNHFFVQNQNSIDLLSSIGIYNATVSGDTRFDRVFQIIEGKQENMIAKEFKNGQQCWVIGSCWPEDFEVLAHFINVNEGKLKFIIAPHVVHKGFIEDIERSLEVKTVRYSNGQARFADYSVLIIDNIGMLSLLYRYGEFAYVGGAFGKGLHNILEAACFGIPVFFGDKNYSKFREAEELIAHGGAFAIADFVELKVDYEKLAGDLENYQVACNASRNYVEMNLGATNKIVSYCHQLLEKNEG